jgi:ABC-2 type transport system ATP-binding protein
MLLRMIAGLIRPTTGEVYIDNKLLHKDIDFPESIGVLIETPNFWNNYTGREVLYSLAKIKNLVGIEEIDKALERSNLCPDDKRTIKKYSLGMKQRLGIAQAIMEKPEILLLDEPSNALDKKSVEMVRSIIMEERNRGVIVILASHNKEDLDVCDMVLEMEEGHIVKGE